MPTVPDLVLVITLAAAILVATPLMGGYMASVLEGRPTLLSPVLAPVERAAYRLAGIDPTREQGWSRYAVSVVLFSVASMLVLYLLQRLQGALPLNPTAAAAVSPELAFNTAVSFVTNTNWQNYAGETTMAHLTQMAGLTVQNFASAAVGIAVAIALVRGLVRRESATIGNFWADLLRATLYILLPIALVAAVALVGAESSRRSPAPSRWRPSPAASRRSRSVPSRARRRSRSWAPMAAGRSTPTPPIPSRTRRR